MEDMNLFITVVGVLFIIVMTIIVVRNYSLVKQREKLLKIVTKKNETIGKLTEEIPEDQLKDIHGYFGLSYANYLVIPRSILQSSSRTLQNRFVTAIEDLGEELGDWEGTDYYTVRRKNNKNRFISDPYKNYDKGIRRIDKIT